MGYVIGGASTQSRGTRPGKEVRTNWISGARECLDDGRVVLSWPMGQHGCLLGYPSYDNHYTERLLRNLINDMANGLCGTGSYAPEKEEVLAEILVKRYAPYLKSPDIGIRFFSNGTDATQAAVALARHSLKLNGIVSVGYHGGSSPVFNFPPQCGGVLWANRDMATSIALEDYPENRMSVDDSAALVVEVPSVEDETIAAHILEMMYTDCPGFDDSPFLIFDDIVTGFRMHPAGALGYYSEILGHTLRADMICVGKAISTFGKVSALIGPKYVMESLQKEVFASYTWNDSPFGISDAISTLREYDDLGDELYNHIARVGSTLKSWLNETFKKHNSPMRVFGHPSRTAISNADPEFLRRMVDDHNILLHRPQFTTMAHTETDAEITILAADKVLAEMKK